MRHQSVEEWEQSLNKLMNDLDDFLEQKFNGEYKLHPVRRRRGTTSNKSQDGLFSIVANFSLGIGSEFGRGYVVDVHLATLENISKVNSQEIENAALQRLKKKLPVFFPSKKLFVEKDGNLIKIHGDLSLGEA